MADQRKSGGSDITECGGVHDFQYDHAATTPATSGPTPSQTVGPFFAYGLTPGAYGYPFQDIHTNEIAGPEVPGARITIEGQVFDASGAPVHDAMVEIVQADASGAYADANRNDGFTGYGRCGTGAQGPAEAGGDTRFVFHTIRPGSTTQGHAPYINVIVTMRGLLNHCVTRIYFPEDEVAQDPVLNAVPSQRRQTLIAQLIGPGQYRFDIRMGGTDETVFFDV